MDRRLLNKMISLATAIALVLLSGSHSAARPDESRFAPTYRYGDARMDRVGTGELKYLGIFRLYRGALYLPAEIPAGQVLNNVPKRLEVRYARAIDAEDIADATIAGMRSNVDAATYERLAARIVYHNTLYDNVRKGDRVALTYVPLVGTMVEVNGTVRGTIEGADFARAIFSLWLGDKPFDAEFKASLLGEAP